MQTFKLPNYSSEKIHIGFYINIENSEYIKSQIISENPDFNYAFIDASTIISFYQVLAAITDSFDRFGVTDETKYLIVVKINGEEEKIKEELKKIINGTEIEPNDSNIENIRDMTKIRMNYKLGEDKRYNDLTEATKNKFEETFLFSGITVAEFNGKLSIQILKIKFSNFIVNYNLVTLKSSNDIKGLQELNKSEITMFPVLSLPLLLEIDQTSKENTNNNNNNNNNNNLYYNKIFQLFKSIFQTFQIIPQIPLDLLIRSDKKQKNNIQVLISHISWHQTIPIIALSHLKGAVFIYDFRTNSYFKYYLSSPPFTSITCLTFSNQNRLIIGYDNGQLILWTLDLSITSTSNKIKAYCKQLTLVKSSCFSEFPCGSITDLAFSQTGRQIFITTSKGAWVYDIIFSEAQRISFSRCFKVELTGSGSHCFVALGTENSIEIFSCLNSGPGLRFSPPLCISTSEINKLLWASDNRTLFYHTIDSSSIMILYVSPAILADTPPTSRKISTTISLQFESNRPEPISNFVLDSSSERLILSFKKKSYLASFRVYLDTILMTSSFSIVSPIGLIFGPDSDKNKNIGPIDMQFAPKYIGGALLATIWNDRVTFIPMKFANKTEIDSFSKTNW
ncbi:hypothetical protein PCANB_000262 [Pneumocystis canis]|nr:hypothetical protein PCANB_000262 [Pneumocystis canis]